MGEARKEGGDAPVVRAAKETRPAPPPQRSGPPIVRVLGGIGVALLAARRVAACVVISDTKDEPISVPIARRDAGVEEPEPTLALPGYPVEQRVARMGFVRAEYRVANVVRYAPDCIDVVLAKLEPVRPSAM